MIILYQILRDLIDILLAPLFICLLTSLYATSKAKKDLGYEYQVKYITGREKYELKHTEFIPSSQSSNGSIQEIQSKSLQLEGSFYCPFCGYEIKIPKKFCPKCGESLSFLNE